MSYARILVAALLCGLAASEDESCQTPRDKSGVCILITECPPLFSILQNRPLDAAGATYLRKSQCGFVGTVPKVCCPNEDDSKQPVTKEPSTTKAPNVIGVRSEFLPNNTVCGLATQDRIYGGQQADLSEYPWMALVEYEKPNGQRGFYCGGVLINSRYILTAAHCVKGKDLPRNWKLVAVRLGEYNTETETDCVNRGLEQECAPPPINVPVEEQIAHEDYNPFDANQYHDIALLRLIRNVPFSDYVRPICIPLSTIERQKNFNGQKLVVAGWGKTESRSESNIKLKLSVPVRTNEECTSTYRTAQVDLKDGQLCAGGEKGKDSCRGDSGGPLMTISADKDGNVNWYAAGVVSFGPSPCGMENWPGVYTRVAKYTDWIVSKLRL